MAPTAALAFAAQVVRGRWFMAYGSFLILSTAGGTYTFAIYSKDIKSALGYTQEQLNTVGFFKDVGSNVGIHAGLFGELAPPWLVLAAGAAMSLGGYLMLYLSVTGRAGAHPPLWLVCLYIAAGANSQIFAITGALATCVKNFPASRGVVLGLLKGFVGLSGAIFTQLYLAFFSSTGGGGGDDRHLILLVGCLPAAVYVAFLATVRIIRAPPRSPAAARREYRAFCAFLYVSLALAAFLLVAIVLQKRFRFTCAEHAACAAVVLLLLLPIPLGIVLREEAAALSMSSNAAAAPPPAEEQAAATATKQQPPPAAPATAVERLLLSLRPPARGEDHTILQAVASVDMVLLFTASLFGCGGMLTAIDNLGQISESLGYPRRSAATFVSLVSIWSYLGRVAAGFASEALLSSSSSSSGRRRRRLPRPLVLAGVLLLSVPGHLLVALGGVLPGSLYAASVVIGFCLGAAQPLILAAVSELFGLRYYSTLCNFCGTATPLGTYVLNVRVAGRTYDREAARQQQQQGAAAAGKGVTCIGDRCYRESFLVIAAVTVAAAVVALVLAWRTREFYAGDIYAKFKAGTAACSSGGGGGGNAIAGEDKVQVAEVEPKV